MAIRSWPFAFEPDGVTPQEVSEEDFRWTLAAATQDGIWEDAAADPCAVTAAADSTSVTVAPGRGQIRGYGFHVDAPEEVAAPANAASEPRLYWVVARLDRTASSVGVVILEGTAAATPVLPALTRTDLVWDLPLASFRRGGGGGAITNLQDYRCYLNPHGPRKCLSSARPVDPSPGDEAYEMDTGRKVRYHGGLWIADSDPTYPTDWVNIPLNTGSQVIANRQKSGGGGYWPRYRMLSEYEVELRGIVARSGNRVFSGDGFRIGTLPAAVRPSELTYTVGASAQISPNNTTRLEVQPDGDIMAYLVSGYGPSWISLDNWRYRIR